MIDKLKLHAAKLKKEILALYYAYRDPRTGPAAKIVLAVTLGYALSPVDLIPDFIPVLGYLDDLIILPALIALSIKLIPADVMKEARHSAEKNTPGMGKNWFFGIFFILLWIVAVFLIIFLILK